MRSVQTKVTEVRCFEVADRLCALVRESGISLEDACAMEGINFETARSWLKTEREFSDQYRKARAVFKYQRGLDLMERFPDGHPNAGLLAHPREVTWLLAKLAPKEFGDVVRHEVSGQIGHVHITAEQLAALHAREEKAIEGK